jgi:hypothetical protein
LRRPLVDGGGIKKRPPEGGLKSREETPKEGSGPTTSCRGAQIEAAPHKRQGAAFAVSPISCLFPWQKMQTPASKSFQSPKGVAKQMLLGVASVHGSQQLTHTHLHGTYAR